MLLGFVFVVVLLVVVVVVFSTTLTKSTCFLCPRHNQEYKLMKKKMAEMKALEEQQAKQQKEE